LAVAVSQKLLFGRCVPFRRCHVTDRGVVVVGVFCGGGDDVCVSLVRRLSSTGLGVAVFGSALMLTLFVLFCVREGMPMWCRWCRLVRCRL
jgi:uncharacterized membrane protein (UPF0136 family)